MAQRGVGLLQVHATTDNCTVEAWLRVKGRLPFTTRVGLGGSVMALVGLAGQALALIARRRWSPWVAGLSGVFTGAGAALLAEVGKLVARIALKIDRAEEAGRKASEDAQIVVRVPTR